MSVKTYHSISSSSDEEEDLRGIEVVDENSSDGVVKSKILNEILPKVKGVKYDFGNVASSSNPILYSNEITEDDEIWLIQTPKVVNPESFKDTNFKFKDSSRITLKTRKKERRFNVHTVKSTDEKINCVLPLEKTRSFHMKVYPIMGRIVLQEDLQVGSKDETLSNSIADSSSIVLDSINNLVNSQTSDAESVAPLKKKKRKSTKQDCISD